MADTVSPLAVAKLITKWAEANPENFRDLFAIVMSNKGVADKVKNQVGHTSVENPQENWEKLLYTPTSFKPKKDKDGNEIPLTDEDKRKAVWRGIQFRNIGGDISAGLGNAAAAFFNAQGQAAKNLADATAPSARQQELYGASPSQRAAAATVPFTRMLAGLSSTIGGLLANRFYQGAAERRAAYLQSLMDSEYNNMGMPGQYADARYKATKPIENSTPALGGR